jgi:hypothetical protein
MGIVAVPQTHPSAWERYAWVAGIVFVIALVAETVVSAGVGLSQEDSAAKIAHGLHEHRERLLVVAWLSVVYAPMFLLYLCGLHALLDRFEPPRILGSLLLTGGVVFVALHAVSDIGITGLLGAKLASFGAEHDQGVSYTLYLTTFALDSVGGVFNSLALSAAGLMTLRSGVLPRWLGWIALLAGPLFLLQGFGLGGVIGSFGLAFELVAFLLFLVFVFASSLILARRSHPLSEAAAT